MSAMTVYCIFEDDVYDDKPTLFSIRYTKESAEKFIEEMGRRDCTYSIQEWDVE